MLIPRFSVNVMGQGCTLVQAVKALDTIETNDPLEREVAKLFRAAFERRLLDIVEIVSTWDIEEILSTNTDVAAL